MRLVIDCFKLVKGSGKSIGIYNLAHNLVLNLAKQISENKLIVFGNSENRVDFEVPGVQFVCIDKNPHNKVTCILWELFGVSRKAKNMCADRLVFPRGFASMLRLTEEYIIVHDMIPFYYNLHYKGYFNKFENAYIMWRLKASIKHCQKVITISGASKQEILKVVPGAENKIVVIYNGYNKMDAEQYAREDVLSEKKKPYLVAMTSGLPHKNAIGILKAYEYYCEIAEAPLDLKIIGISDTSSYPELGKDIQEKVHCIRYIQSDAQMHCMIGKAKVFLFLSFVEGFGFPPIEAMQLGVPVICSNQSAMPEVVGNAAVLVEPNDPVAVGEAIKDLVNNSDLQRVLVERGYEQIQLFTWEKITKQYEEILFS